MAIRRQALLVVAFLGVGVSVLRGGQAATSALANPGFEDGMSSWTVSRFWKGSGGQAEVDRAVAHSGAMSVKLSGAVRSFGVLSTPVAVERGSDCVVSFRARTHAVGPACFPWLMVTFQDPTGRHAGYVRFSYSDYEGVPPKPIRGTKWQRYEYRIPATDARILQAASLRVSLNLGQPYFSRRGAPREAVVWYDDVAVEFRTSAVFLEPTGRDFNLFFARKASLPTVALQARLANTTDRRRRLALTCQVTDVFGRKAFEMRDELVLNGQEEMRRRLAIGTNASGYYDVSVVLSDGKDVLGEASTSVVIAEDLSDGRLDPGSPFGFHCGDLDRDGMVLEKLGVKWIRAGLGWADVERTKGTYDWQSADRLVGLCERHHMQLLPILHGTPGWAATPPAAHGEATTEALPTNRDSFRTRPPADYARYEAFVSAFFTRYSTRIEHVELWNEPDFMYVSDPVNEWSGTEAEFSRLLTHAWTGAKRVSPANRLLFAGLTVHEGKDRFVERVFAAGGKEDFDIVSLHGYGPIGPFVNRWQRVNASCGRQCPAWDTEFGIASTDRQQDRQHAGDFVRQNTENLAAGIEKSFYFTLVRGPHPFSIVRGYDDNTAKPVVGTIPFFVKTMRHARFLQPVEFVDGQSRGYIFDSDTDRVAILWGAAAVGPKLLDVGMDAVRVADMMGGLRTEKTDKGRLIITLTADPVYLFGVDRIVDVPRPRTTGRELVVNGGFEDVTGDPAVGVRPAAWELVRNDGARGDRRVVSGVCRTGLRSLEMSPAAENEGTVAYEQRIGAADPGEYRISAWVRATGLQRPAQLRLVPPVPGAVVDAPFLASNEFRLVEEVLTLQQAVPDLRVGVCVTGRGGKAWVDDVSVCALGKAPASTVRDVPSTASVVSVVQECDRVPSSDGDAIAVWPREKRPKVTVNGISGVSGKAWQIAWEKGGAGAGLYIYKGKGMVPAGADALSFWARSGTAEPFPVVVHINEGTRDQFTVRVAIPPEKWTRLTVRLADLEHFWGAGGNGTLDRGEVTQIGFKAGSAGVLQLDSVAWVALGTAPTAEPVP